MKIHSKKIIWFGVIVILFLIIGIIFLGWLVGSHPAIDSPELVG